MPPWWIPYVLVALVLLGELPSMRGRRPEAKRADRGTLHVLNLVISAGYVVAFSVAARHPIAWLPAWLAWCGVPLTVLGTAFRVWSIRTLGRFFTRTVQVSSDQPVITDGPYRVLRHPSYSGGLFAGIGVGLSLGSVLSALAIGLAMLIGFAVRIRVEERALLETLGEPYRRYAERTWRLIPFIF